MRMYGFEEGQMVRSLLKYTDAHGLLGKVTGFEPKDRRVLIAWNDGIESAERPEYIELVREA